MYAAHLSKSPKYNRLNDYYAHYSLLYSSADCLTPKGFTFMRVKFGEGIYIDAYNLHADAG